MIAFSSQYQRCKDGESVRLFSLSPSLAHDDPAMEDAHAAVLTLEDGAKEKNAFFGVYDGHGGKFLPFFLSSLIPRSQAAPSQNSPEKTSTSVCLPKKPIARSVMTRQ